MENNQIAETVIPPLQHGNCPACAASLDGAGIWQHFYDEFTTGKGMWTDAEGNYSSVRRLLSHEEAEAAADKVAENYGASRYKGRWGRAIGIIENDRCNTYRCPDCNAEWDAATGELNHG